MIELVHIRAAVMHLAVLVGEVNGGTIECIVACYLAHLLERSIGRSLSTLLLVKIIVEQILIFVVRIKITQAPTETKQTNIRLLIQCVSLVLPGIFVQEVIVYCIRNVFIVFIIT